MSGLFLLLTREHVMLRLAALKLSFLWTLSDCLPSASSSSHLITETLKRILSVPRTLQILTPIFSFVLCLPLLLWSATRQRLHYCVELIPARKLQLWAASNSEKS